MKYSIIDEISNVLALSTKKVKSFYDYSMDAQSISERFIQASDQLSKGEYIGWQLCLDKDGKYHSYAFSKKGVNITKEDLGWIFQDRAANGESDQGLFMDSFRKNRKIYCLTCPSIQKNETNKRFRKEKIVYYKDVMAALKEFDVAVRIIASAEKSGKGIILFSFPEEVTLRMKIILSFAFVDMPLIEVDKESSLPESALISSKWISIGLECLLEALNDEKHVEESTEEIYLDEYALELDEDEDEDEIFDDYQKNISETKNTSNDENDMTSIEELELSVRSYNCLRRAGVHTIGQLRSMTYEDLSKVRNLGKKSADEIMAKLEEHKPICSSVDKTAPAYMEMLNELIGLENVKEQVGKIVALAKMKKDMNSDKSTIPIVLNMEFVGNPGTAKTTVARIFAGLLYENGLLQSNEIVEVGRADLIARYEGQTADKVKSVFQKAKGKLLFIDEAYSLVENTRGEFGDEAINTIVQETENNRDDTIVIFAGYPDEMQEFFSRNPGLRSRVPFIINFCDYTPEEMVEISELEAKKRGFSISSEAKDKIAVICESLSDSKDIGNGRFCRNLIEGAILNYASRVYGNAEGTACKDFTLYENDIVIPDTFENSESKSPIGFQI